MIYIHMDLRQSSHSFRNRRDSQEKKVTLGPFVRIESLYSESGELRGIGADGAQTSVLEAVVGQGGYCDTCEYNYVGWRWRDDKHKEWDVMGFRVALDEVEKR